MATTLKSVLLNLRSRLAFKTLVFGLLLLNLRAADFSLWSVALFLGISLVLYLQPIFQTFFYIYQFLILLILVLMFVPHLSGIYLIGSAAGFSLLFYLLLGLKNLVFINRFWSNYLLHLGLLYGSSLVFFLEAFEFYIFKLVALFFVSAVLFNGLLKGRWAWSFLPALLVAEAALLVSWLPVGFLQSANIVFAIAWFLGEIVLQYRKKEITAKIIFNRLGVLAAAFLIIALTSRWSL